VHGGRIVGQFQQCAIDIEENRRAIQQAWLGCGQQDGLGRGQGNGALLSVGFGLKMAADAPD
jgi:hypothetical protein